MSLKKIRLELARTSAFPEGSSGCGYEFNAPLTRRGLLDIERWQRDKALCTVRRFWQGEKDELGGLVHRRSGWMFSYKPGEDDDEPIFRFDKHAFVGGEYVSVTEHDGVARPFRIVNVSPAA